MMENIKWKEKMNWISFIIFFFFHLVGILFPFHLCANKIMKENKIMREEIQSWPWKSFLLLGFNLQHMIVNDWDRDHDYAVGWKPDQEKEDSWRSRERAMCERSCWPQLQAVNKGQQYAHARSLSRDHRQANQRIKKMPVGLLKGFLV